MRFRAYRALARGVLLESLRRKDLWVIAILGFIIICASGALGFFGVNGLEVFAKDLAVSVLGLFSTIVAVLTSSRLLPDEIKQRTLYPLLSRPISRFDLIIGKLCGAILVSWISFLMLSALTAVALIIFQVDFHLIMAQYLVAKMLGLALVCAVTLMFSVYMTPAAAATISFVFAFGSTMMVRALVLAGSGSPGSQSVYKLLNALVPQYDLFDFGSRAVYNGWSPVPFWVLGWLLIYAAIYSSAMVMVTWAKFKKQAV